jgi:hypothetical protein
MRVFGDIEVEAPPASLLRRAQGGRQAWEATSTAERQDAATRWLLDAGILAQALLDDAFDRHQADAWSAFSRRISRWMRSPARAVVAAIDGVEPDIPPEDEPSLEGASHRVRARTPEGFAVYGVHPELYVAAARRLGLRRGSPVRVIGIRSIGVALGAVVAAALGCDEGAMTVRPVGHPFARRLNLDESAARALLIPGATYIVVDEGPGLSGSSFRAVADWLEGRGVSPRDIVLLPSHAGEPGSRCSEHDRHRWRRTRRSPAAFDEGFFRRSVLARGETIARDLGGGAWRGLIAADPRRWPPAHKLGERAKYLVVGREGTHTLFKFAGLGRIGDAKFEHARSLHRLGFAPKPLALRRGFLVHDWIEGQPLSSHDDRRDLLLDTAGRYLAMIARQSPAPDGVHGASVRELHVMSCQNTLEALGAAYAKELDRFEPALAALERDVHRVCTDNKWHIWEWICTPHGRLMKTDGLDHHRSHDLVGAQDVSWDLAASAIELQFTDEEVAAIEERLPRRVRALPGVRQAFYRVAYLAFEVGRATVARESEFDELERTRLAAAAANYARLLALAIGRGARR